MELKTSMELITILAEKHLDKQSVKKTLKLCGLEKHEDYNKPLTAMCHEDVIQAIFKWIGCNITIGQAYEVRMRVKELQMTYGLRLANRTGSIYVTRMWDVPKDNENELHCWLPDVSYQTLSADEINKSSQRAEAIGQATKAVRYAMAIWQKPE